jgi:cytochrome P450
VVDVLPQRLSVATQSGPIREVIDGHAAVPPPRRSQSDPSDQVHERLRRVAEAEIVAPAPTTRRIPPGPKEPYCPNEDLLGWMSRQFKEFGNIYKASIYGTSAYVITDPRHAYHVLVQNWQNYVKGQIIKRVSFLLGNGIMVSEGELWKKQRRVVHTALHRNSIGALSKLITTANLALLEKWQRSADNNESVNVTRDVSSMILEVVLVSIFGVDYASVKPHFNILSEEPARNLEFARQFRFLGQIILDVVSDRRKEHSMSPDILGVLMTARNPQGCPVMSDRQLINEVMTLVVAGHETTASTLNWMWYLISQHPDVEEKLAKELSSLPGSNVLELDDLPKFPYARQILEECLRLYPAGWLMTRKALNDDRLGDYFVPTGTEIYISPYFIQRHPDLWDSPDRFDPDRFAPDHLQDRHRLAMLPFSAGPRNCIGELLARIEMQIHLMIVAKQLRLRYVNTMPIELEAGVNLRSKHDFIMMPERNVMASP